MRRVSEEEAMRFMLELIERGEKSPRYVIDMGYWHHPVVGQCRVCMAGAVMAMRDGLTPSEGAGPEDFLKHDERKLEALNLVRCGRVSLALAKIHGTNIIDDEFRIYDRVFFQDDKGYEWDTNLAHMSDRPHERDEWREHMLDIAAILEVEGL